MSAWSTGVDGFRLSLQELSRKYRGIRRSRGDGSCFYRCFMVGLGEALVDARVVVPGSAPADAAAGRSPLQGVYESLLSHVEGSVELLIALGYPEVRDVRGSTARGLVDNPAASPPAVDCP